MGADGGVGPAALVARTTGLIQQNPMRAKDMKTAMKTPLFALIALLTMAACSEKTAGDAGTPSPAKPAAAVATPPPPDAAHGVSQPTAPPAAPLVEPSPAAGTEPTASFEFSFTSTNPGGKEGEDPRILRWEDGPCGVTPVARVSQIPLNDPALLPDYVVEFDDSGKEIKRWGKPYEAEVVGLEGDLLRFRTYSGRPHAFWTDLQGRIGTIAGDAAKIPDLDAPTFDCPTLPTFADSDYTYCSKVTDTTGRVRKLAWDAPCT